jgi:hypothetical protein
MSFKDELNNDAVNVFLNSNEGAEEISYTPYGGSPKIIKAIVNRQRLSPAGEDTGRALLNQVEIMIANKVDGGVMSINKGGDTVSLPERVGGIAIDWNVADILGQDEGMWHLLLQK